MQKESKWNQTHQKQLHKYNQRNEIDQNPQKENYKVGKNKVITKRLKNIRKIRYKKKEKRDQEEK